MTAASVPGLSLVLVRDSKVIWSRGFGVADVRTKTSVDADTVFEAGSMSKPVFAYVVLKLAEKGILDLDTPLTSYTTERFLSGDTRLSRITARHVLSHTAGFQNWRSKDVPLHIQFEPGTQYLYSGEGYSYLQSVVTALVGRRDASVCERFENDVEACATDFDAFMRGSILMPFAMTSSGYLVRDTQRPRLAAPHDEKGRRLDRPESTAPAVARYGAAGALKTTPTDYAKFLIEVIDPRPDDMFRLKPATLAEMLRPRIKLPPETQPPASYALGWMVWHLDTGDVINHGGDNPGFKAFAAASVARKSGFVLMTNGDAGLQVLNKLVLDDAISEFL